MLPSLADRFEDFCQRQHPVDAAGGDGAARHAVEGGLLGILCDRASALFPDRPQSEAAVAAGAGKDHGNGALAIGVGQGMEKEVEGQAGAMALQRLGKTERAGLDREIGPRRDDVDLVGLDGHAVGRLPDSHRRVSRQQSDHHAFMGRIEVLDQDVGHAAVGGDGLEETPEGIEPASRSAEADHQKVQVSPRGAGGPLGCRDL